MNVRTPDPHIPDQDLLLAADGELPAQRTAAVQAHLVSCWTCRTRMRELEGTIADFVHVRETAAPELPPASGARAQLQARLAEMAVGAPPSIWNRLFDRRALALACIGVLGVWIGMRVLPSQRTRGDHEVRAMPDPNLTPGAVLPVTREDVCGEGAVEGVRIIPATIARKVFAAYGIDAPEPRAYEVDYLITPALGGADNVRNFWPQPYDAVWNAHTKDALEDHLRGLVCAGQVDLSTAQQDIAHDWIAAYKKYFHTDKPLPEHFSFLKDRPWE